jgi:hypothetical protein
LVGRGEDGAGPGGDVCSVSTVPSHFDASCTDIGSVGSHGDRLCASQCVTVDNWIVQTVWAISCTNLDDDCAAIVVGQRQPREGCIPGSGHVSTNVSDCPAN